MTPTARRVPGGNDVHRPPTSGAAQRSAGRACGASADALLKTASSQQELEALPGCRAAGLPGCRQRRCFRCKNCRNGGAFIKESAGFFGVLVLESYQNNSYFRSSGPLRRQIWNGAARNRNQSNFRHGWVRSGNEMFAESGERGLHIRRFFLPCHLPAPPLPMRLDTLHSAETPEGISLALRPAGIVRRVLCVSDRPDHSPRAAAGGCDRVAVDGGRGVGLPLVAYFAIEWLYPVVFELSRGGATPGERWMGLRVVMDSGLPVVRPRR